MGRPYPIPAEETEGQAALRPSRSSDGFSSACNEGEEHIKVMPSLATFISESSFGFQVDGLCRILTDAALINRRYAQPDEAGASLPQGAVWVAVNVSVTLASRGGPATVAVYKRLQAVDADGMRLCKRCATAVGLTPKAGQAIEHHEMFCSG